LFDRQVQFDSRKSGWPWVEGTVSWVAPTAMAMLAHRAWGRKTNRLNEAAEMLIDRACPQGGWNAGNSVVFGVSLNAHPDFTAMALMALRDSEYKHASAVSKALDYLGSRFNGSRSPYSLAWAVMALTAYGDSKVGALRRSLETAIDGNFREAPIAVLALAALALETPVYAIGDVRR
jgi:hypothetical protein